MVAPISDLELEVFEQIHKCPNTHPGGGCQKCAMVARIKEEVQKFRLLAESIARIKGLRT